MKAIRLAMIGGGNMGRALVGGLLARGFMPGSIHVAEADAAQRERLAADFGIRVAAVAQDVVPDADVVVLAVKPQDMRAALSPLQPALTASRPLLLSVAAGLRAEAIADWCGPSATVVRAMPNRPALVGAGVTGVYAPPHVTDAQRALVATILEAVGTVVWVSREQDLDTVTAISGSGPAYFFLLAEALAAAGVARGLDAATARALAVGTLHGSGELAKRSDGDVAKLRAEVTSRGGTTEAALRTLASAGFADSIANAVEAAAGRSRELAAEFGQKN